MGKTPVKVNETAGFFTKLVALLITGVAAPAILTFAYTQAPWLKLPIIKQIFEYFINKYAGKFSYGVQDGVISIVVDAQIGSELAGVVSSLGDLQEAQKSGDQNAIDKALGPAMDKWGDLIHWDGIAPRH